MFRRLLLVLALTSTVACSMPVAAGDLVQLDVVDRDNGQVLPEYRHRGQDWIAGVPGHRYSVRLTNTTGERVLVVLSVDGVNAVTGQTASPSQGGYVLEPWESAEIAGWRKSLDDIAQFVFTDLADSYAARTGRPRNVGVIGIAVFQESRPRRYPLPAPPIARDRDEADGYGDHQAKSANAPAMEASDAGSRRQGIGTGHGQREWSPVGQTHFARATRNPVQVSELRYDEPSRLNAMGITTYPRHRRDVPRAFPDGFVADPPYR